jgi:hypothetical protein
MLVIPTGQIGATLKIKMQRNNIYNFLISSFELIN